MSLGEQLSVFCLNRPGQLERICEILADAEINIRALSVVDGVDHGIVRLILDEPEKAKGLFTQKSLPWISTQVLLVELPNRPGVLAAATKKLADSGINIEYAYGSTDGGEGASLAVFRVSDAEKAARLLVP